MRSVSKDVIVNHLRVFGKDILKDDLCVCVYFDSFFEDLPQSASKELSQLFKDNTYLVGNTKSNDLLNESSTTVNDQGHAKHAKALINLKKQLKVIKSVQDSHIVST